MTWRKQIQQADSPGWEQIAGQLRRELAPVKVEVAVDSAAMVTLRCGGSIALLVKVSRQNQIQSVLHWLNEYQLDWMVMGGGSNILVRDNGLDSVAIVFDCEEGDALLAETVQEANDGRFHVELGAAVPTTRLIKLARQYGWSDIAPLAGIPGQIGGAVHMNAGSGQVWLSQFLDTVSLYSVDKGYHVLPAAKLKSAYRDGGIPANAVVTACSLTLEQDSQQTAESLIDKQIAYRAHTQPRGSRNCGSVFRNPQGESAGALIESVGLKGVRVRGAQFSEVHANFIENLGTATAGDVESLVWLAQRKVRQETGIDLKRELRIVGRGGTT